MGLTAKPENHTGKRQGRKERSSCWQAHVLLSLLFIFGVCWDSLRCLLCWHMLAAQGSCNRPLWEAYNWDIQAFCILTVLVLLWEKAEIISLPLPFLFCLLPLGNRMGWFARRWVEVEAGGTEVLGWDRWMAKGTMDYHRGLKER